MHPLRIRLIICFITMFAFSPAAEAGEARKYVELALRAMGGKEVVDGVRSLDTQGKLTRILNEQTMTFSIRSLVLFPDHYRQEITLENGMALVTIMDSEIAVLRVQGADIPLPEEQWKDLRRSVNRIPVKLLQRRREIAAETAGTIQVGEREGILLSLASGDDATTLVIDTENGELMQVRFMTAGEKEGERQPMEITYSDFREVEGLRFPFASAGKLGGRDVFSNRVDSLVVNGPVPGELWEVRVEDPPASEDEKQKGDPTSAPTIE